MGDGIIPSPDAYLNALYGESGYLSHAFPGYVPRAGQVALAEAVDRAIVGGRHLLAEAPTGTGKGQGYGGPASYHSSRTKKPVVITTANIALQEQLFSKDLPLLQRVVPWKFTFALLKGRNNYLCRMKYEEDLPFASGKVSIDATLSADGKRHLPIVREWARKTIEQGVGTGDKSELPIEPDGAVWNRFSISGEECLKDRCVHQWDCYAQEAMSRARHANIVVTNYAMLFVNLGIYQETGLDCALPPANVYILDEAHEAAKTARDFFGAEVTEESVKRIARLVREHDPMVAEQVGKTARLWFHAMDAVASDKSRYGGVLHGSYRPEEKKAWTDFQEQMTRLNASIDEAYASVAVFDEKAAAKLEVGKTRLVKIRESLSGAMNLDKPNHAYFVKNENGRISVNSRLIKTGELLGNTLFSKFARAKDGYGSDGEPKIIDNGPVTVIATSATLTTHGTSFAYAVKEFGLGPHSELIAPSPFDWPKQMLFIVPGDMVDSKSSDWQSTMGEMLRKTVLYAGGRTLGLFTSYKNLNYAYDVLLPVCKEQGIALFKQGDAPRTQLIEAFKKNTSSVLLGVSSFWAGVDAPGETLSVVFIDKFPFTSPDDPVMRAIDMNGENAFTEYSVPNALIAFKQGVGRLIRSTSDKGVVVCCDTRINTARYGKQFLAAIPRNANGKKVLRSSKLTSIIEWLKVECCDWDE